VRVKARRTATALVLALAIPTACGADDDGTASGDGGDGDEAASAEGDYPVTVEDCNGVEATVDAPPERVVTLTYSVLETLFWLGAEGGVISTGTPPEPGQMPAEFDAEAQEIRRLTDFYESASAYDPVPEEVLLGEEPDFVVGAFSSHFDAEAGAASQERLAELEIPSYQAFSLSCSSALTGALDDLDLTYRDLENLGAVMGEPDRAEELVAEMQGTVDGVQEQLADLPDDERPGVFAWEADEMSEGDSTPYATGNRQTINAVINLAGGRNVFADEDFDYERVGWEAVAERDPDVVLIITYATGDEADDEARWREAEDFLRSNEATRNLPAVQEGRFAHLLYEEGSSGGVRNATAVEDLAAQLHPDLFGQAGDDAGDEEDAGAER
jgi:iron complex transport system substrate-binding protein